MSNPGNDEMIQISKPTLDPERILERPRNRTVLAKRRYVYELTDRLVWKKLWVLLIQQFHFLLSIIFFFPPFFFRFSGTENLMSRWSFEGKRGTGRWFVVRPLKKKRKNIIIDLRGWYRRRLPSVAFTLVFLVISLLYFRLLPVLTHFSLIFFFLTGSKRTMKEKKWGT